MHHKTTQLRSHYNAAKRHAYLRCSVFIVTALVLPRTSAFTLPTPVTSSSTHLERDTAAVRTSAANNGPTTTLPTPLRESGRGENVTERLEKNVHERNESPITSEADLNVSTDHTELPSTLAHWDQNLTLLTLKPLSQENREASSFPTATFDKNTNPFSPNSNITRTSSSPSFTVNGIEAVKTSTMSLPLFSLPTPLPPSHTIISPCGSGAFLEDDVMEGSIEWRFQKEFCQMVWYVRVPEGYGVVVEFNYVWMEENDTLEVITFHGGYETHRRFFSHTLTETVAPLMVKDSVIHIIFTTPQDRTSEQRNSNFNLSYIAHNNSGMPLFLRVDGPNFTESVYIYDCAGMTNLPNVIMCDGIRHCENGEDEDDCAYLNEGCGDWFPHGHYCFKASFKDTRFGTMIPGHSHPTMPLQAAAACQSEPGATLASLHEPGAKDVVVRMIRHSGFRSAVVGLKKVKPVSRSLKHLYRFIWQWGEQGSPIAYDQQQLQINGIQYDCAFLDVLGSPIFQSIPCVLPAFIPDGFICMKANPIHSSKKLTLPGITFRKASTHPNKFPTKQCPDGSLVQVFHRCQWHEENVKINAQWSPNNFPLFQCRFGQAIHYSLLCNGIDDCADGSDEMSCLKPRYYPILSSSFICRNAQAIAEDKRCNAHVDCFDESDEESCDSCGNQFMCSGIGCVPGEYLQYFDACPKGAPYQEEFYDLSHGSVYLSGDGIFRLQLAPVGECTEGFYLCQEGHCIPSFLLNNGEHDCPLGEDEGIPVHNMTCPGYYRCHRVGTCIHKNFVCDGVYHCPYKDDEMYCQETCPYEDGCICEGQAYKCSKMIDPLQNLHVRYLDLSHASEVSLGNLHFMEYLFFLNLSSSRLSNVSLGNMPQLQTLDLSSNSLTGLASLHFQNLPGLRHLDISNNPLVHIASSAFSNMLNEGEFYVLEVLIMSNVSLEAVGKKAFSLLSKLKYLDIRANLIHSFDKDSLFGLTELEDLYADEYKLCCDYFHPTLSRCHAPADELSSCSDLLAQDFFRVFLWALSMLAVSGNAGVLIYRTCFKTHNLASTSVVLVRNLCVADLLMGIYLMMIGIADAVFRGVYVSEESRWRISTMCTVAGFLSFVSSEVSAFSICLITLDRVLVICFPFKCRVHFSQRVTFALCLAVWIIVVFLAAVPLMTGFEFYGHNGICIPLPITRKAFSGQTYAFGIFIVLNFIIFIFIGLGQLFIFRAVRKASRAAGTERREQDVTIARRLFVIVLTDFCCWFPIGLMGLLTANDIPIPGQVNVWVAIFVLPLNSALNPFLYTWNGLKQRWKKQRVEKRTKKMFSMMETEIPKLQPTGMEELIRICIRSKAVKKEVVMKMLGISTEGNEDVLSNSTCAPASI